jgi:transposase
MIEQEKISYPQNYHNDSGGKIMEMSIGFDVSKKTVDVAFYDGKTIEHFQIENNPVGFKRILDKIEKYNQNELVLTMEATGVYHLRCASFFKSLGFFVSVVNPLIIKRYSDMKMSRVKTDKTDAKLIAYYGFHQKAYEYKTPSKNRLKIQVFLKTIEGLKRERTQHKNRIEALTQYAEDVSGIKEIHDNLIDYINNQIKQIEREILNLIEKENPEVYSRLLSIPGVGKRVAASIVGYFGEMENFESAKQLVSFIGSSPSQRESGSSVKGKSHISRKGNSYLRKLLFLAALSACKYNKSCKDLFERLTSKGKAKKAALVAVANKLSRQIFAIVKFGRSYDPLFCSQK